jgi:hypothetical protein
MSYKMKGWVARDSYEDALNGVGLILHHTKPTRCGYEWSASTILMHLPYDAFPEVTWESEPIEVVVTLTRNND